MFPFPAGTTPQLELDLQAMFDKSVCDFIDDDLGPQYNKLNWLLECQKFLI